MARPTPNSASRSGDQRESSLHRFSRQGIAGAGIGLRPQHYQTILNNQPAVPWFEVLTENYFGDGGLPHHFLERVRADYPVTLHGVGMSLGSVDPLDQAYLVRLKALADRIEPAYISDHLAWISVDNRYVHDLLPLPYTQEALENFALHVRVAQDFLGRQLLIENASSYMVFTDSEMTEAEFLCALVELTDCELLFDVNNVYVSGMNHGFDPAEYLHTLPADRIKEIHLAGYEEHGDYLFDTHGQRVHPPVWDLYQAAIEHLGPIPTLIEWDTDIPPFETLQEEAERAQKILNSMDAAA